MFSSKENFKKEFEQTIKSIYAKPYKNCTGYEKYMALADTKKSFIFPWNS